MSNKGLFVRVKPGILPEWNVNDQIVNVKAIESQPGILPEWNVNEVKDNPAYKPQNPESYQNGM